MYRCDRVQASAPNSVNVLGNVEKVNKHQSGNVYSPLSLSLSEYHGWNSRVRFWVHTYRKTVLIIDILRKDKSRQPYVVETDVATSLLSRDYKGLSNYANGVIEVRNGTKRRNK